MFKKAYYFIAFLLVSCFVFSVVRIPNLSQVFAQESTDSATVVTDASPTPTPSPAPSPSYSPSPEPSATASPTPEPEASTTPEPTVIPSPAESPSPTPEPSATQTPVPSPTPTASPTESPTPIPSVTTTSEEGQIAAYLYTDQADYSPTQTAIIFGNNFKPNETYTLEITADNLDVTVSVTADENGNFAYSYQLDGIYRPLYNIVAKDSFGAILATTSFTDKPAVNLDQCANGPLSAPASCTGSAWQNGNLNENQAHYLEGQIVPYRAIITGVTVNETYTVKIEYDTTQSGKHAIDYLNTYNVTEGSADPCNDIAGANCSSPTTFSIPPDTNVTGAVPSVLQPAGNFTLYNGNTGSASGYTLSGDYTGNSSTSLVVTFTATANGTAVLAWGGHIAARADWGQNNSAIFISGSPYHMRVIDFTCSNVSNCGVGNQDRSLSAEAIIFPGSITVTKVAQPNDPQDFAFTTSGAGLSSFSLDDDSDSTLSNTTTFSSITNFGTKTITEGTVNGWSLTGLNCSLTGTGSANGVVGTKTATIDLQEGDAATCTFINELQQGTLHVIKTVINDSGGTKVATDFSFQVNGGDVTPFESDGQNDLTVNAGQYTVTEPAVTGYTTTYDNCTDVTVPAGDSATCTITNDDQPAHLIVNKVIIPPPFLATDPGKFNLFVDSVQEATDIADVNTGTTVDGSTPSVSLSSGIHTISEAGGTDTDIINYNQNISCDNSVTPTQTGPVSWTVDLPAGSNVTCTITNSSATLQGTGTLTVIKNTLGGNDTFNYTTTSTVPGTIILNNSNVGPFSITTSGGTGSQVQTVSAAPGFPATVNLAESTPPTGWDFTSLNCSSAGGSTFNKTGASVVITFQDEDSVICTYTNTKKGHLIVQKTTLPGGDNTSFSIEATGSGTITGGGAGSVTDAIDQDYEVTPGTYSISETVPTGWDKTGDTCQGVVVGAGETKTCEITNTKRGHVIIQKNAVPDSSQDFTFQNNFGNGNPSSFQMHDDSTTGLPSVDSQVLPGTYAVSEDAVSGWKFEGATCSDGSPVSAIVVSPGETVTCTFENAKLATITLVKNTVGGNGAFDFTMTGNTLPASAQLTTDSNTASQTFSDIDPDNTYTISETIPTGWVLTSSSCTGTNSPDSITPNAGEEITCTFTNNKPAAQIDLSPLTATNKVGQDHVITATVQTHNGNGTYGPAVDGTLVTFAIVNSNGATADFVGGVNTCTTTSGSCSVTINSPTTGNVAISASSGPVILGVTVNVSTDGQGDNSTAASKNYVNAKISITPSSSTNEVNDDHDFIVEVEKDTGSGFVPVPEGTLANAIVTPSTSLNVSDCNDGVNASGQCSVIVNSASAGIFTIAARSTVVVNGIEFKLQTNGVGENSVPAVKTYVDASIALDPPTATNSVNDTHTITAHVTKNDGGGVTDANGVTVTFSNSGSAAFVGGDNDCVTDSLGLCSVSINSSTPGANTIDASTTFNVGGVSLTRATNGNAGPNGSDGAEKTYVAGKIIINKVTVGGDGEFDFTTNYNAGFALSNGDFDDSGFLAPGSYSVSEVGVEGWDTTVSCISSIDDAEAVGAIELDAGETVTCTFINTKLPKLTVTKVVINDNGGTKVVSDFPLFVDAGSVASGVQNTSTIGPHSVSETTDPGYTSVIGGDCTINGSITLTAGDEKTCTITNNDNAPSLTLVKHITNDDGGVATESAWTLAAAGPTGFSGAGPTVNNGDSFDAGTYNLSESGPSGYVASNWVCVGGTQDDGDTVTLGLGESATCTITNNDIAPTLKLVKEVTNNNGGDAEAGDWDLSATGTSGTFTDTGNSTTFHTVKAGVGYILSESTVSGYSAGLWSCDAGSLVGDTVTLGINQNVTCTITNNDVAPTITLIKDANNDNGGNALPDNFQLTIGGQPTLSGVPVPVDANTPIALDETQVNGYSFVSLTGDAKCPAVLGGTVTLDEGENITCTITNDDIQPKLTVTKVVHNNHGGPLVASDFPLFVDQTSVTTGQQNGFNVGTYTVSETLQTGYTKVSISGDCNANGAVTLAAGDVKSCTITNEDIAPQLTVVKHVINDNGGSAVAGDFTMNVGGTNVSDDSFSGSEGGTTVTLNQGSYSVDENSFSGYTKSIDTNCSGTINVGDEKTCTLTNDDQPGTLVVRKVVVNDNGGTLNSGDFSFQVNGGGSQAFEADGQNDLTVNAGTYSVLEPAVAGYDTSYDNCSSVIIPNSEIATCTVTNNDQPGELHGMKFQDTNANGIQDSGDNGLVNWTIYLDTNGNGVKDSSELSTTTASDGTYSFTGLSAGTYKVSEVSQDGLVQTTGSPADIELSNGEVVNNVNFGNAPIACYPSFTKTFEIAGAGKTQFSHDQMTSGARKFYVIYKLDGGLEQEIELDLTNPDATGLADLIFNKSVQIPVPPNLLSWSVGLEWKFEVREDSTVLLSSGFFPSENLTPQIVGSDCQQLNSTVSPVSTGTLFKIHDIDGDGNVDTLLDPGLENWSLTVTDEGGNEVTQQTDSIGIALFNFDLGSYTVSETQQSGWFQTYPHVGSVADCTAPNICTPNADGTWTVEIHNPSSDVTLAFGNAVTPKLRVIKEVINDNGGNKVVSDFPLTVNGEFVASGEQNTYQVGSYTVSETGDPNYTATFGGDCDAQGNVSLAAGDEKICTITNNDIPAHLVVVKHVINQDDFGLSLASDFTMIINGVTADGGNSFPGNESGTNKTLTTVGAYNVTESGPGGYNATYSSDCSGTIGLNETKTCTITNEDIIGRMTGGGSVFTKNGDLDTILGISSNKVRVTHGFQIHCRLPDKNDNIEINWNDKIGKSHKFHLETLTNAVCTKAGNPSPPKATANGFNIFTGIGVGRYDGVPGATLSFVFTDFGEPGRKDTAEYTVTTGAGVVLDVNATKYLDQGNHQAHRF